MDEFANIINGVASRIDADVLEMDARAMTELMNQRGALFAMPAGYTVRPIRPFIGDHITYGLRLQSWPGFRDEWITGDARAIAAGIVESGDWSRLVILADAIQDAALLGLMRLAGGLGLDMGGWWVMERMTA